MDPKKGEGNKETRVIPPEGSPETSKTKETVEARDDPLEVEEKASNGDSKDPEADLSPQQMKDQDEDMALITVGESLGKSEEESGTEEEEEEEGEIELTTPRMTKTKGRKSKKEVREQTTYKDKLQGSQLTLEKLLKNPRNTRQQGHA